MFSIDPRVYVACPNLAASTHRVTSPGDTAYNCIAHTADDGFRWWWPIRPVLVNAFLPKRMYYWPAGLPSVNTLENFVAAYETIGYERCLDGEYELGFEKVALYERAGEIKHAAKQLSSTEWTSKIGDLQDIAHDKPEAVAGDTYGSVVAYLRRATKKSS